MEPDWEMLARRAEHLLANRGNLSKSRLKQEQEAFVAAFEVLVNGTVAGRPIAEPALACVLPTTETEK